MEVTKRSEGLPVIISIEGTALNQVESFRYLDSLVSEDGRCDAEVRAQIGITKANFGNMWIVLANLSLIIHLRMRILRCYVWSGLLYGC